MRVGDNIILTFEKQYCEYIKCKNGNKSLADGWRNSENQRLQDPTGSETQANEQRNRETRRLNTDVRKIHYFNRHL